MIQFVVVFGLLVNLVLCDKPKLAVPKESGLRIYKSEFGGHDKRGWVKDNVSNAWEHSGYLQGDIMMPDQKQRNVARDKQKLWPAATIPFYIEENDYSFEDQDMILTAMDEYHLRTILRFRPLEEEDSAWIHIKGSGSACSSYVGMFSGGQEVSLGSSDCMDHAVILHELLHAAGFDHQQCAQDRDDYIHIHYENIAPDMVFNFDKANFSTSFGLEYDYNSIMHYSQYAFSMNGEPTMSAKRGSQSFGTATELSTTDIKKISLAYQAHSRKLKADTGKVPKSASFDNLKSYVHEQRLLKKKFAETTTKKTA